MHVSEHKERKTQIVLNRCLLLMFEQVLVYSQFSLMDGIFCQPSLCWFLVAPRHCLSWYKKVQQMQLFFSCFYLTLDLNKCLSELVGCCGYEFLYQTPTIQVYNYHSSIILLHSYHSFLSFFSSFLSFFIFIILIIHILLRHVTIPALGGHPLPTQPKTLTIFLSISCYF